MLTNPFNWRVRWPRPARVPLFSLGLKVARGPCGLSGRLLTHYRQREVRNSIYRYRKIHIDYRSKFLYRFISPISIIYGNTNIMYISINGVLTHWSLGELDVISGMQLSISTLFFVLVSSDLFLIKSSVECHGTLQMNTFNHVHICQVSLQLSCDDTCLI